MLLLLLCQAREDLQFWVSGWHYVAVHDHDYLWCSHLWCVLHWPLFEELDIHSRKNCITWEVGNDLAGSKLHSWVWRQNHNIGHLCNLAPVLRVHYHHDLVFLHSLCHQIHEAKASSVGGGLGLSHFRIPDIAQLSQTESPPDWRLDQKTKNLQLTLWQVLVPPERIGISGWNEPGEESIVFKRRPWRDARNFTDQTRLKHIFLYCLFRNPEIQYV